MRKLKITFIIFGALVACGLLVLPIMSYIAVNNVLWPKLIENNQRLEKQYALILKDLEHLDKNPLFKPVTYEKDAQELLTKHISWMGDGFKELETDSHTNLRVWNKAPPKWTIAIDVKKRIQDPEFDAIDTSWVPEILNYDHWSFASHPQIRERISKVRSFNGLERIGSYASMPIPSFTEFQQFVRVYFLQQYKKGNVAQGSKVLRKAAQLAHSSGSLVSSMVAVALLKTETNLVSSLKIKDLPPQDQSAIDAYKRLAWAWTGIIQTPWIEKWDPRFEAYLKPELGLCAGVGEQFMGFEGLKDMLIPQFPFEVSFRERFTKVRPFQQKLLETCHMKSMEPYYSDIPATANPLFSRTPANVFSFADMSDNPSPLLSSAERAFGLNITRVPYLRRMAALAVMTVASPNSVGQYESLQDAQ